MTKTWAMRKFWTLKLAVAAALIGLVMGPQAATAQSSVDGDWQVGSEGNAPQMTIAGIKVHGHTGCRAFSAKLQGTAARGRIVLAPLSGSCTTAKQRAENRFLNQLRAAASLAVRKDRLEVRNSRGTLLFSASRVTTAAKPTAASNGASNGAGSWRPVIVAGRLLGPLAGSLQTIRVTGSRLVLEGHCNTYAGTVAFGPASNGQGNFAIFISERTQRLCADERFETDDADLLEALETARSFQSSGSVLRLYDASGKNVAKLRLI